MRGLWFQINPSCPDGQSAFAREARPPALGWKKLPGDQLCTKSVRRMPELNAFASLGLRWPTAFRLGDALILNPKAMMGNDL